jgi:hypothetical protein
MIFEIGERVELHPATNAWMMGDRFGQVENIGRKYVHVRMDRSGRLRQVTPEFVLKIGGSR